MQNRIVSLSAPGRGSGRRGAEKMDAGELAAGALAQVRAMTLGEVAELCRQQQRGVLDTMAVLLGFDEKALNLRESLVEGGAQR